MKTTSLLIALAAFVLTACAPHHNNRPDGYDPRLGSASGVGISGSSGGSGSNVQVYGTIDTGFGYTRTSN